MPNGGEDCCGTCSYNSKNKGASGYDHAHDREADFCILRNLLIENAFYTYCANHPLRNPEHVEVPIGPVFKGESLPPRWVWSDSADDESIRSTLLEMLGRIPTAPADDYPMGLRRWEIVIWQLGEFREARATSDLRRLTGKPSRGLQRLFSPKALSLVQLHAFEALHKIERHPETDSCPRAARFIRGRPSERVDWERQQAAEALEVARAFLNGELGAIEASRRMERISIPLSDDLAPVVAVFREVVLTTQSYPEGPGRAQWNVEALAEKDRQRTEYEATVVEKVREACRFLVDRMEKPAN